MCNWFSAESNMCHVMQYCFTMRLINILYMYNVYACTYIRVTCACTCTCAYILYMHSCACLNILTLQRPAGTATFVAQPPSSSSASVPQPSPAAVPTPTISNSVESSASSSVPTASSGSTKKPDLLGGLEVDPFHTSESHALLNNAYTFIVDDKKHFHFVTVVLNKYAPYHMSKYSSISVYIKWNKCVEWKCIS